MSQPSAFTRMRAALAGEVSAETLEAYRKAGGDAHALLIEAEQRRSDQIAAGNDPWTFDAATQAFLLCAWNAFVLQKLGDEYLRADYEANPKTVGFVPPVTADQVLGFYSQVEQWVSRARQAAANPHYVLDVMVPAELPTWAEVEPCPADHLIAILAASDEIHRHAEVAVGDLRRACAHDAHKHAVARADQELAAVSAAQSYARGLYTPGCNQQIHERAEQSAKDCIERAYRLGQLAAMPGLIDQVPDHLSLSGRLPGPGDAGFDKWCLTDPETRHKWMADPRAVAAVDEIWRDDPNPRETLRIQAQIDAAAARGDITRGAAARGRTLGHYFKAPWAAIYTVNRPLQIGGKYLRPMQQFTFDVCGDELLEGGEFERAILVANFTPTRRIEYEHEEADHHR